MADKPQTLLGFPIKYVETLPAPPPVQESDEPAEVCTCEVCGSPINPGGFFNAFEGNRCLLFCSRQCSDKHKAHKEDGQCT